MERIISLLLRKVPRKHLQRVSHIGLRILKIFYIGKKVQCNVCDSQFRKFLPYGRGPESRPNALCPQCLTLERHRLIWAYLKQETDFFTAPRKMLHVAPELPFIERFEKIKTLEYITADLDSPLAKVKMDVHDIPFEENTFDVLFCNHVLEHVDDDIKVLNEFKRVLKPGAWAILQSPIDYNLATTKEDPTITDPVEREKVFGQDDHVRMYGRDYAKRLNIDGLKVVESRIIDQYTEEEKYRLGMPVTNESIYIVIKE